MSCCGSEQLLKMTLEVPQERPGLSRHVKGSAMGARRFVERLVTLLDEVGFIHYIWCARLVCASAGS